MSDATVTPINEAISLRIAAAQKATRLALHDAPEIQRATRLANLIDGILREAAAMGVDKRTLLEAQARALSASVHSITADKDAGQAVLKSTCDLARSQLNFLHAFKVERWPFARAADTTKGEHTS